MGTPGCSSEPGKVIADSSEWIGPAAQDVAKCSDLTDERNGQSTTIGRRVLYSGMCSLTVDGRAFFAILGGLGLSNSAKGRRRFTRVAATTS